MPCWTHCAVAQTVSGQVVCWITNHVFVIYTSVCKQVASAHCLFHAPKRQDYCNDLCTQCITTVLLPIVNVNKLFNTCTNCVMVKHGNEAELHYRSSVYTDVVRPWILTSWHLLLLSSLPEHSHLWTCFQHSDTHATFVHKRNRSVSCPCFHRPSLLTVT